MTKRLLNAKARLDRWLGWFLTVPMATAVLAVLWQVMSRYVLKNPSTWTDELVRYLLVWIGLLGGAYVAGQKLHLAIDLLPMRLTGRAHHVLGLAIQVLIATFAVAVLGIGGAQLVKLTFLLGQTSAALALPLGYVYAALPLAGILIVFYSAVFATEHVEALRGEKEH